MRCIHKQVMKKHLFIVLFFALPLWVLAQQGVGEFTLDSKVLKEQRKILVFTPEDYDQNQDQHYQVAYVLDGEWHFHYLASLIDKLQASGTIPKMIVIGIVNTQRSKDLTPAGSHDNPRFGGAKAFLSFITEELQPWVNQKYRTYPYNVLMGHSFGGLFTVYAAMEEPKAFQGYIALSPSLGRNSEQQVHRAQEHFSDAARSTRSSFFYMAVGNEGGYTKLSSQKLHNILKQAQPKYLHHTFEILPGENHESITATGFLNGLRFGYQSYYQGHSPDLDELFLVEDHYSMLSDQYGYTLKVPESFYQKFAQEQLGWRELDYAQYILEQYQQHYPQSLTYLRIAADVHLLKGEFEEAKANYIKLQQAGVDDPNLTIILKRLEAIKH